MIKSITAFLGDRSIRILSGVLTILLTADYLGPVEYGKFNITLSWILLFSSFTMFGIPGVISKTTATAKEESIAKNKLIDGLFLKLLLSVASIIFLLIFHTLDLLDLDPNYFAILFILPLFNLHDINNSYLEVNWNGKIVLINTASSLIFSSLFRLIIYVFDFGIYWFVSILILEYFTLTMLSLKAIKIKTINISFTGIFKRLNTFFHEVGYFGISSIAFIVLGNIDQVMIGKFLDHGDVGYYSFSYRILFLSYTLMIPIGNAIFKIVAKNKDKVKLKAMWINLFSMHFYTGLFVTIFILLIPSDLITKFLPEEYYPVALIFKSQALMIPFLLLTLPIGKYILLKNLGKFLFFRAIIAMTINVGLNFLLIPSLGTNGAILATTITYLWLSIVSILISRKKELKNILSKSFKTFNYNILLPNN